MPLGCAVHHIVCTAQPTGTYKRGTSVYTGSSGGGGILCKAECDAGTLNSMTKPTLNEPPNIRDI